MKAHRCTMSCFREARASLHLQGACTYCTQSVVLGSTEQSGPRRLPLRSSACREIVESGMAVPGGAWPCSGLSFFPCSSLALTLIISALSCVCHTYRPLSPSPGTALGLSRHPLGQRFLPHPSYTLSFMMGFLFAFGWGHCT